MNHKQRERGKLVSRLRVMADRRNPTFKAESDLAIDLRQAANEIEDLAETDDELFRRRLYVIVRGALHDFFNLEADAEPEIEMELIPTNDDRWRIRAETNNMLVILTVEVPRRG